MERKVDYKQILTAPEVVQIGYRLSKFERGEISYKVFDILMKDVGIQVTPVFVEVDMSKLSGRELLELKSRINFKELKPSDIDHYIVSTPRHKDFIVRHDRTMIKTLAEYGDPKAQRTMQMIKTREVLIGR